MELSDKVDTVASTNIVCRSKEVALSVIVDDMTDKNVSSVLLLDEGKISGIVTERDLVRKIVKENKTTEGLKAKDVMTPAPLITIELGMEVKEVIKLMKKNNIKSVPVVVKQGDFEDCNGLITQTDIVHSLVE